MTPSASDRLPLGISLVLVACGGAYFARDLGAGHLQQYDEFYSALRSLSFVDTGDWFAIVTNYEPMFKKPPLQYMLSALTIQSGLDLELSLRLWSFLFSIGTLLAGGLLAHLAAGKQLWAMPLAIALLSSSGLIWQSSRSAMLDSGMAFFVVASLCATFLAKENPRWWIVTGAIVGLGALQKAPLALLANIVVIAVLNSSNDDGRYNWRSLSRDRNFKIGAGLCGVLVLYWPVVQVARFGATFLNTFFVRQMAKRFSPGLPGGDAATLEPTQWIQWLIGDNAAVAALYLGLLALALFLPKYRRQPELFSLCVFLVLSGLVLSFASGRTYSRYLLPLLPIFAAIASAVLVDLMPKPWIAAGVGAAFLCLSVSDLVAIPDRVFKRDWRDVIAVSERLQAQLEDDETPVLISPRGFASFPPGAFLLYAKLERMAFIPKWDRLERFEKSAAKRNLHPPFRGIAHRDHLPEVDRWLGPVVATEQVAEWVIWKQKPAEGS